METATALAGNVAVSVVAPPGTVRLAGGTVVSSLELIATSDPPAASENFNQAE